MHTHILSLETHEGYFERYNWSLTIQLCFIHYCMEDTAQNSAVNHIRESHCQLMYVSFIFLIAIKHHDQIQLEKEKA